MTADTSLHAERLGGLVGRRSGNWFIDMGGVCQCQGLPRIVTIERDKETGERVKMCKRCGKKDVL